MLFYSVGNSNHMTPSTTLSLHHRTLNDDMEILTSLLGSAFAHHWPEHYTAVETARGIFATWSNICHLKHLNEKLK